MKIKNFAELATTDARRALLSIAEAGLEAIDTTRIMQESLRRSGDELVVAGEKIDLTAVGKLVVIAIGKCAAEAATVAEAVFGDRIDRGVVVDVKVCPVMEHLQTFCGTHPLPSSENLSAAAAIKTSLEGLTDRDLVLFVISGGGSTLLFLPENPENRDELIIFNALTDAGATIEELNIVRKHLSLVRGGYLAKYLYPARAISLIFSDVPGNDVAYIASGPTVRDTTTVDDAAAILAKFGVQKVCPIENCGLIETPKEEKYFERVKNVLVASNERALRAMHDQAMMLGLAPEIRSLTLVGEAADVGRMLIDELRGVPPQTVLLWGGETTVTVRVGGEGGRNLTVSAAALEEVARDEEILSLASDGRDHGPFAGAICDTITLEAVREAGLDLEQSLAENRTYPLFQQVGHYLMTGDTGSNVSDLIIALKFH